MATKTGADAWAARQPAHAIQAIECYLKERPEAEQRLVDALLARSQRRYPRQPLVRPG